MKFSFSRFLILSVAVALLVTQPVSAQVVNIPDPNLREAIREALELPPDAPITQQETANLTRFAAWNKDIKDLTGLEHAIHLNHLSLRFNQITDLSPIANLIHLEGLMLDDNPISDISPLAGLINLKILRIPQTLVTDFTPLQGLNLTEFHYDQICNMPPVHPPVTERIKNRSFPSVFQAWGGIGWSPVENRPDLSDEEHITLHDLYWKPRFQTILWDTTSNEPTYGIATQLAGNVEHALQVRQRWLKQNPNMVFLGLVENTTFFTLDKFPPGSDFWLRDANGQILTKRDGKLLINFVKPEVQDLIAKRIIAFDRCGLYDGVMIDGLVHNGTGFGGRHLFPYTDEDIIQAYTNIFENVRSQVRDDFLILINANHTKPTLYAEFVNSSFMETGKDHPDGYSRSWLMKLEDTLSWNEENLREPRINCLEGEGMSIEPPDGPNNLRWMRLFTTLSLIHSDGYILYTDGTRDLGGPDHHHLWHSFWDADLGRPVGSKAQPYENIDGLFIREFTNGWAVYNRSGQAHTISLPQFATPAGNGDLRSASTHLLPDLDGEIYLKVGVPFDLNADGIVNVLDLILVSQRFGTAAGDVNSDGTTNILDLTSVVQQFK